jgi:inosine-uridine nucleoside N-ribohydrolase
MKNVWMDCDPGHDDFFALILCATHPSLHLLGVSTTAGNQSIEKTTKNALRALKLLNKKVPVVQGLEKPLLLPGNVCPEIHGESGLDLPDTEEGKRLEKKFQDLASLNEKSGEID